MSHSRNQSLLGSDFPAVCARYGAPLGCTHDGGVLRLAYLLEDGSEQPSAIELVDGVVTSVAPGIERSPQACCGQELVGLPIEQALPELGPVRGSAAMRDSTELIFDTCVVTVHEGTIACVVPHSLVTASP